MTDSKKKILVVDDEAGIVAIVKSYLENAGYEVYEAYDGKRALELFDRVNPSLVVLDLMLPDIAGEEICRILRRRSRVPVIMLTAKVEEESVLQGLDIGADDYVTKPFSPKQLVARVAAVLRRTAGDPVPLSNTVSFKEGDLVIDGLRHEVRKQGNVVNLTPNEYRILMTLVKYPTKTFTRRELVEMAMGEDFEGFDRTVDTHVKNLRQKIENDPKEPEYVLTVHGVGYRFNGDL